MSPVSSAVRQPRRGGFSIIYIYVMYDHVPRKWVGGLFSAWLDHRV